MADDERQTMRSPPLESPHVCEHCAPVREAVARLEARYGEVIDLIREPPWLAQVLEAGLSRSALADVRGEVTALQERVSAVESRCDDNHPLPTASIVPLRTE